MICDGIDEHRLFEDFQKALWTRGCHKINAITAQIFLPEVIRLEERVHHLSSSIDGLLLGNKPGSLSLVLLDAQSAFLGIHLLHPVLLGKASHELLPEIFLLSPLCHLLLCLQPYVETLSASASQSISDLYAFSCYKDQHEEGFAECRT